MDINVGKDMGGTDVVAEDRSSEAGYAGLGQGSLRARGRHRATYPQRVRRPWRPWVFTCGDPWEDRAHWHGIDFHAILTTSAACPESSAGFS